VFASTLLNFVLLPLLLLSGGLLPLTLAPDWIQPATLNPFSYAVDAARSLFGDASVLYGFGVMAVLALLALWWAEPALSAARPTSVCESRCSPRTRGRPPGPATRPR
jgi:ABC-type uncharacterized transport system permease subunit